MADQNLKAEQQRFVDYYGVYCENSEEDSTITAATQQDAQTQVKTANANARAAQATASATTPTASAKKTIQTRKTTLGPSTVSKPAMAKLKQSNKK